MKKKKETLNMIVETITRKQKENLYKDLAVIRHLIDKSISNIGLIDSSDNLAEAAFKAGRAYDPLDEAMDKLVDILDKMREDNDFDHFEDLIEE
jgi:hypothetical protein